MLMALDYFIYYGWRQYFWPVVIPVVVLFFGVLLFNFFRYSRVKKRRPPASPVPISDEAAGIIGRETGKLIACKTVWKGDGSEDVEAFAEIHNVLKNSYPGVHRVMKRSFVDEYSVVYRWKGEGGRRPVLFLGHLDVLEAGDGESWSFSPFEGLVADEFVYGRGALKGKGRISALMLAAERLIEQGFSPMGDIFFAFLHDSEYSERAAKKTVEWFKDQGVSFEAVFDEGGRIDMDTDVIISPVAYVSVTEKCSMNVKLTAKASPGTSAVPPDHTAVGMIAEAIGRLEYAKFPIRLGGVTRPAVRNLGPYMSAEVRMVAANRWLFKRLFDRRIKLDPILSSHFRTTLAATMVAGGTEPEALPTEASAMINIRLAPEDYRSDVEAYLKAVLKGLNVSFEVVSEGEKAFIADTDARAYRTLAATVYDCFGSIPVVPFIQSGRSNGRIFEPLCRNIYRFTPIPVSTDDIVRMHGQNERVRLKSLGRAVEFYALLYKNLSAGKIKADGWKEE